MPLARRVLHVVTVVTVAAGAWALWRDDAQHSSRESASVASSTQLSLPTATATSIPIESFAPANEPDTFQVSPVLRRVPVATPPTPSPASVPAAPPSTAAPSTPRVATTEGSVGVTGLADVTPQLVARLERSVSVYANLGDRSPAGSLRAVTEFGNPRVLPVVQQGGDWLRVELPTRPNGSLGWIRTRDVTLSTVDDRVDVDLADRSLTWTRGGVVQFQVSVAVGAPATPTPLGDYFVTDVLPYPRGSEYGAWVVALNGHSDAFTEFEGGDARIAIHGTNDPGSIGRAASNGCVRVPDDVLAALASALPPGTPVTIH